MKILCIFGSPVRGNCLKAAQIIEKQLTDKGDVQFEYVFLSDLKIPFCIGCHSCILRGEDKCPHRNVIGQLEKKIEASDGIVFVTPIHCMQVSALMKNFFDHFAYRWHRPKFFGKKVLGVCVGVGSGPVATPVLDYIKLNSSRWGMDYISSLSLLNFAVKLTPKFERKRDHDIQKTVDKFYSTLKGQKFISPSLRNMIWFNIWRNAAETGRENKSVDFLYWSQNGWMDNKINYFYQVKIFTLKIWLLSLINKMIQYFGSQVFAK